MEEIYQKFHKSVEENYPKNKDKIFAALEFATKAHDGIVRKSGEPYIIHPISVSQILIDNNMDYSTVMAGLLHDVVEDTSYSVVDIEKHFGKVVAKLVDGVTKIDEVTLKRDNLTESDSIKRLLIAMGDDVRVIFIKLADRLHNMRTIKFLSPERQYANALETQELFIPIAERIGIRNLRTELSALVFECLHKEDFEKIKSEHDSRIRKNLDSIHLIENKLLKLEKQHDIDAKISWWPEKYYSIYKKLKLQGVNKAYGLVLFKIIVPTIEDCYKTLGYVHQIFKPVPAQIKDYIASPKANGYQSLHSVVMSDDAKITFNVMIRTPDMDNVCEYGILAFKNTKDSDEEFSKNLEKLNKLKAIISGESKDEGSDSFIDAIKTDLSANATWVFTPKIKPIKIDSSEPTAIDFAYALHSQIGDQATGAIVNGKPASLRTVLKNGDVVEILLSNETKSPSRDWVFIAKTYLARKKMKEYFSKHLTKENIAAGKLLIKNELKLNGYSMTDIENVYPKIKLDYSFSSIDDMFASVAYGGIKLSQILNYVSKNDEKNNALTNSSIIVQDETFASSIVFSKCCCPIVGDEIVAVKSKNNISIHTANCLNLKNFDKEKILKVSWKDDVDAFFEVNLKVVAKDAIGFGSKMLGVISNSGFNVTKVFGKQKNGECEFILTIRIKNSKELDVIMHNIANLDGVKSINRSFE